jgi:hypothetical protein
MITRTVTHPNPDPSATSDEIVAEVQTPEHTGRGIGHGKDEAIAAAEADLNAKQREDVEADAADDEQQAPEGP